ncbi:TetR family transcriptional regulator [bacterium 3DAC]|nr:TetR family transcriptional regulator [bacterium 3DAC]
MRHIKKILSKVDKEGKETTKEKIVKVAMKLFAEKGYSDTSVNTIVREAGVSKGAFFHYWKSKEDLLREMLDTYMSEVKQAYNALAGLNLSPKEKIRQIFRYVEQKHREHEDLPYMLVVFMRVIFTPGTPLREKYVSEFWKIIYEFIEKELGIKGMPKGSGIVLISALGAYSLFKLTPDLIKLPNPDDIADVIWDGIKSVANAEG